MLRSVDLNLKPSKMSIAIAKPSGRKIGTKIGKIKDFSNPSLKLSLGRLNEISFTVPYKVERRHKLVDNKIIDKLKNRYLLYVKWNNVSEWFIINEISDSVDDGSEGLSVHAFSLGHELADKLISQISNEEPVTPRTILTTALSSTNWSVGTIDERIINKYRSFDVTETTVLDFLSTIADTYGAILVFDSENRRIDLIHPDNYKINRGFRISYGHYLQSLSRVSNSDDMTTRLTVSGKDGLGINTINPTGANYIESFAYFMYPFERDANRNVIKSSAYMSDSLCHAILDYEALVESKKGQFSNLLISLSDAQGVLTTKQNELFTLNTELLALQDQIDVLKAAGQDYSDLVTKRDAKQVQVNAKKAEIVQVENEIASINSDITSLKNILSIENNFTPDQIHERNYYIIEKTWSDENYTDAQELYDDAKVKFDEIRKPKINLDVTSVNFFNMIEEQRNWDKLYLGDVVTVRHPMININYEVFVTDMEITDDSLNLTIADFQEVRKDEKLLEMLKASYSSSTTVDMNKYKWSKTINDLTEVNEYINSEYDATKRRIIAGVDESVEISNRGIIIRNPNFPNEVIIIQSGVVALSRDNGETWKTAIKPTGIIAERLIGSILIGESLYIENSSGKFRIDTDGITINDMALFITGGDGTTSTVGSKFDEVNKEITTMKTDLSGEIDDVEKSISDLDNYVDGSFRDGVIEESEAIAISKYINSLNTEKDDIDNRYIAIYNNVDLTGAPKTDLSSKKNTYDTAHTNLIKSINTAISNGKTSTAEKNDVDSKFALYKTALANLSSSFEDAINAIGAKRIENVSIGGRNWLLGTSNPQTLSTSNIDNQGKTLYYFPDNSSLPIKNKEITLSFDWEVTGVTAATGLFYMQGSNPYPRLSDTITLSSTNMKGRHVSTRTLTSEPFAGINIRANYVTSGATIKISNMKIELGNKATDWSPAPEDITKEIGDVAEDLATLDDYIDGSFKDGVIQESEAKAIATYINSLNVEKDDIDKKYNVIFANRNLTGDPKIDLNSKKSAFDTSHTNLIDSINKAISDGKTTLSEKNDVDAKFELYKIALANLSQSFEEALDAINNNKVENISIGGRNLFKNSSFADGGAEWSTYTPPGATREIVDDPQSPTGKAAHVTGIAGYWYAFGNTTVPLEIGKKYTISVMAKGTGNLKYGWEGGTVKSPELTTNYKKYYNTFTYTSERNFSFYSYAATDNVYFHSMKLESGEKSTDWSPAPEDIIKDISDVNKSIVDLDDYVDGAFKDGIIQESEAKSIATYINSLNAEKIDLDNRYTSIYNNTNLKTASVKTALSTAKTNYNTSHANLITSINNAISDGKTTSSEKTDVDTKFNDYRAKLGALSVAFENAMDDISNQKASDGKSAWAKFSGAGNTLPAGNVTFGNGLTSTAIEQATLNFNNRNDRISTAPRAPVVDKTVSGTVVDAIDHTSNTDGSVNISFEWDFNTSGAAGDIDGFILYIYQGTSSTAYSFGTNQSSEQVYYVTNEKRAFILYGVPANRYYTFGVQSYRIVDKDINISGVLKSSIIKSTASGHNPYRPSETVAFSGKVTGTIGNNTSAAIIEERSNNALQLGTAYNNVTFSADAGILVNRSDKKTRAILNATDGLKIQKSSDGSTWTNVLYADTNGVLNSQGLKISSADGASVLIDAQNKSIDFSKFITILGKVKAENVQIGSGTTFDSGYNPSANDTKLRNDLKLTASLPTSLSLSSSGIKATTSDPNKYALLDYRGMYIKQGAITIERPDGAIFMQNGLANLNYSVQPMYPSRMESGISVNGYYYMAQGTGNTYNVERACEAFTMRHEGSVLVVEVNHRLAQGATGAGGFYLRGIDAFSQQYINNGYSFYNESEGDGYEVVRINLGKPTYQRLTFYLKLKSGSYGSNAYLYVLRMYQEG